MTEAAPGAASAIWDVVERLVDATPSLERLLAHRLHLFGARRWRALGRPIPAWLHEHEFLAQARALAFARVLERAREAYDGTMVLYKGPAVGVLYPDPSLRPFSDLDLIVEDAGAAQAALQAHGFEEFGDPAIFEDIHHLRPLRLPDLPVHIEIHDRPKWPEHLPQPPVSQVLAAGIQTPGMPEGILTLPPAEHSVLLAAHAWGHEPLLRFIDLVDIAAVMEQADRQQTAELARTWKIDRVWRATVSASDSILGSARPSMPVRLWARHLPTLRERTVLEAHLEHWLSTFWTFPPRQAAKMSLAYLADELRPATGESWRSKLRRARLSLGHALVPRRDHNEILGDDARKPSRRTLR